MRKLKVDLLELEVAFGNASYEMNYYLDTQTGEVILVTGEMRRELEEIYKQAEGEDEDDASIEKLVQASDAPEWMKPDLLLLHQMESDSADRYIPVPKADSHEGYADMEDFIATVRDRRLQDRLWDAIRGRGAFRRFKDVLLDHPRERERWFAFSDARRRERVLEWLESEGIEPDEA